jgi:hypothetical protein
MMMENADLKPHASVLSRSALSAYITGPISQTSPPKSNFNPYRKRSSLLNIVNLEVAEETLSKSVEREEGRQPVLSLPESLHPLTGPATAT